MAGILSGLDKIGLGDMGSMSIYDEPEEKGREEAKSPEASSQGIKKMEEKDFLFPKSHTCPVCYAEFKTPTIRVNKLKPRGADSDLRPRFDGIDPLKYDVVMCHECGYAALGNYFDKITPPQAKLIKEGISKRYRKVPESDTFSYDQAFMRYQLALGNTVVKRGKTSEKAYLCLKMAWIMRGKREAIDAGTEDYDHDNYLGVMQEIEQTGKELLSNAIEGFVAARLNETFPMCGMDRNTIDYIIAVEAMKIENYAVASQTIDSLLARAGLSKVMQDKCKEMKAHLEHKVEL